MNDFPNAPLTEVVCGVLVLDHQIFLGQRRPNRYDFPLTWECPGGVVESGESHEQALTREWQEEVTGTGQITVSKFSIWDGVLNTALARFGGKIHLFFYAISLNPYISKNDIQALEAHCGYGWFSSPEFTMLNLAPGNRAAEAEIKAKIYGT